MTNLEALKSTIIGYPVDENTHLRILLDRGIDPQGEYAGKNQAFELATADVLSALLTAANFSEGDLQISLTEKSNFMKVATGIYNKWGEPNPLEDRQPTVTGISPW